MTAVASMHRRRGGIFATERAGDTWSAGVATTLACVAHMAFAWVTLSSAPPPRAAPAPRVTEVDLAPPPPPPLPVVAKPSAPDPVDPPANTPAKVTPPAPAARAGNVLHARDDAPAAQTSDAVDFVTDPNGTSYGIGSVSRGGTADRAPPAAAVAPASTGSGAGVSSGAKGDLVVGAENLSRAPRLTEADPCGGRYPRSAHVDEGLATVSLVVRPDGRVASASVLTESPNGEGFGAAARECLSAKTFEGGLDKEGRAVTARATIRVRFSR